MTEAEISLDPLTLQWVKQTGLTQQDFRRAVDNLAAQIDRDAYALAVQSQPVGSVMRTVGRHSLDA